MISRSIGLLEDAGQTRIQVPLTKSFNAVLLVAVAVLLGFAFILCTKQEKCRNVAKFMWSCFMKPISNSAADAGWCGALGSFYADQAGVSDASLRKGQTTMMKLALAHLCAGITPKEKGQLVWVDVRVPLYHMLRTVTDWWRNWMEH